MVHIGCHVEYAFGLLFPVLPAEAIAGRFILCIAPITGVGREGSK